MAYFRAVAQEVREILAEMGVRSLYLSFHKVELNLFLYLLLAIIHQQAMLFYNSLLKIFETKGTASGCGVALGYVGSAIALILLAPRLVLPMITWF